MDRSVPVTSAKLNNAVPLPYYTGPVTMALTASDSATGSGIYWTCYMNYGKEMPVIYTAPVTFTADGTYNITCYSRDITGNWETQRLTPDRQFEIVYLNWANFTIDTIAPTIQIGIAGSSNSSVSGYRTWFEKAYSTSPTHMHKVTDSGSGIALIEQRINGGPWQTYTTGTLLDPGTGNDGTFTYEIRATDKAGNVATASRTVHVDRSVPVTSAKLNNAVPLPYYTGPVTMALTASDSATGSGIYWTCYMNYGKEMPVIYTAPVTFTADGTYNITCYSRDIAGNSETQRLTPDRQFEAVYLKWANFTIDTIAPTIQIGIAGSSNSSVSGYWDWYEGVFNIPDAYAQVTDSGSGIALIEQRINGGPWQTYTTGTLLDPGTGNDGTFTYEIRATDKAGNVATASRTVHVDRSVPVTSAKLNNAVPLPYYTGPVTMALTASDGAIGSGICLTQYMNWHKEMPITYTGPVTYTADGTYNITCFSFDNAGNWEPSG